MMLSRLKRLEPGNPLVWIYPLYEHTELWRNEGTVTSINNDRISCEVLIDQMRTIEFFTETGINVRGPQFGWAEVPGLGPKSIYHTPLDRYDIVQLLWLAKRMFDINNEREQRNTLRVLISGIQGMTDRRPTVGPIYERMKLVESLYHEKAPRGAIGNLPDAFLDYMTLS